jgi:hypothetical protein
MATPRDACAEGTKHSGSRNPDLNLLRSAEVAEPPQLGEQVFGHETQSGSAGGVLAYHHDGGTADLGDTAVAAQRLGQQGLELSGPGFLVGGTAQQLLQWSKSLVAFTQKIKYLAADHASACCRLMRGYRAGLLGRDHIPENDNPIRITESA